MTLPRHAALIGAVLERDDDRPVVAMPFGEQVVGRPGFLHGGAIGGLLDLAARATLNEATLSEAAAAGALDKGPARAGLVTMTVDYLRSGRERETRAAARVVRLGRRVATVEASAWQDDRGRPIATARFVFAIERG